MKNRIIFLVILAVFSSFLGSSQNKSIVKNKLSLVYDISYSPKWIFEESGYSLTDIGLKEAIKYTSKEHSITANYKLLSRLSISMTGGFIRNKMYFSDYTTYKNLEFLSEYEEVPEVLEYPTFLSVSYGLGLNLFFKKGLAPTDSHLGLYIKQYSYSIKKEDVFAAFYPYYKYNPDRYFGSDVNTSGEQIASKNLKYNITYIGVKYNYTRMITKTLPVFWNIGCNLSIPISSKLDFPSFEGDNVFFNNAYENSTEIPISIIYFKNQNILKINVGLGYIF